MAGRVARRFSLILTLVLALVVVISGLIAFLTVTRAIDSSYRELAIRYNDQRGRNASLFLELLEESTRNLAASPSAVAILAAGNAPEQVLSLLNRVRYSNLSIMGVTLAGASGALFSAGLTSSADRLDVLGKDTEFAAFLDSTGAALWLLQAKGIEGLFARSPTYPIGGGVLSLIYKLRGGRGESALMLIDVDLRPIFRFMQPAGRVEFAASEVYLVAGDGSIIASPDNAATLTEARVRAYQRVLSTGHSALFEAEQRLLIREPLPRLDAELILALPPFSLNLPLAPFIAFLAAACTVLVVLAWLVSRQVARSISIPITELHTRMQRSYEPPAT